MAAHQGLCHFVPFLYHNPWHMVGHVDWHGLAQNSMYNVSTWVEGTVAQAGAKQMALQSLLWSLYGIFWFLY